MIFKIKEGDTSPAMRVQLIDPDGEVAPLDLADSVEFHLGQSGGEDFITKDDLDGDVSIVDTTDGIVQYSWKPTDTEESGIYEAEFVVTYNNREIRSYPNFDYIEVNVKQDILGEGT